MININEYITHRYISTKEEHPHIKPRHVRDFLQLLPTLVTQKVIVSHRDLRFIRRILLHANNLDQNSLELIDFCFPNDLGPFAHLIFKQMCPEEITDEELVEISKTDSNTQINSSIPNKSAAKTNNDVIKGLDELSFPKLATVDINPNVDISQVSPAV
jgi:hypothetical protein